MKAKTALEILSQLEPDDNICMLLWTREVFEDEHDLTDENWAKVCDEFDKNEFEYQTPSDWLYETVTEYAQPKEVK